MKQLQSILRYAAGKYWIISTNQKMESYIPPIQVNTTGAQMYQMFQNGETIETIAQMMSKEYELPIADIRDDVEIFLRKLEENGYL